MSDRLVAEALQDMADRESPIISEVSSEAAEPAAPNFNVQQAAAAELADEQALNEAELGLAETELAMELLGSKQAIARIKANDELRNLELREPPPNDHGPWDIKEMFEFSYPERVLPQWGGIALGIAIGLILYTTAALIKWHVFDFWIFLGCSLVSVVMAFLSGHAYVTHRFKSKGRWRPDDAADERILNMRRVRHLLGAKYMKFRYQRKFWCCVTYDMDLFVSGQIVQQLMTPLNTQLDVANAVTNNRMLDTMKNLMEVNISRYRMWHKELVYSESRLVAYNFICYQKWRLGMVPGARPSDPGVKPSPFE